MKYHPEPIKENGKTQFDVPFPNESGGVLFDDQENALIFCLLLEIRDLLEE